jgi:hypothetical protein
MYEYEGGKQERKSWYRRVLYGRDADLWVGVSCLGVALIGGLLLTSLIDGWDSVKILFTIYIGITIAILGMVGIVRIVTWLDFH